MVSSVVISWAHAKAGSNKHIETTKVSSADGQSTDWSTLADVTGVVNNGYAVSAAKTNVYYASGDLLCAKIDDCATTAYATDSLSSCL